MRGAIPPVLVGLYLITQRQKFAFSLLNFEDNLELAMHMLMATAKVAYVRVWLATFPAYYVIVPHDESISFTWPIFASVVCW